MYRGIRKKFVEYIIYCLFWGVLILLPFGNLLMDGDMLEAEWDYISRYWLFVSPAIVIFLINNHVLIPFLLYKKKGKILYLLIIICMIALCYLQFVLSGNNATGPHKPIFYWEWREHRSEKKEKNVESGALRNEEQGGRPRGPRVDARVRYEKTTPEIYDFFIEDAGRVYRIKKMPPHPHNGKKHTAFLHPLSVQILFIVFVLAFNICVRLFFFTVRNEERLKELERQKIKSELECLKYQINPHFFMNTLNNIHALIDIDKDLAQSSIIKLAKMMQRVLYESSSEFVSLEKELSFLNSYIDLMRLRYTDILKIDVAFPNETRGVYVPSLLFISFLENAFKHGVTYNHASEIAVSVNILDGWVVFCCRNTMRHGGEDKKTTGIGMENARKRLSLLYGNEYTLEICKCDNYYNVLLKIPVKK